jgi:sugar phosphate isomerase/epimerase
MNNQTNREGKMNKMSAVVTRFATLVALILSVSFLAGSAYAGEKSIVLKKYPTLKIGFTTQNFAKVLPVTVENTKKLIDFAADQGYPWIELRDANGVFTQDECKQISDYARSKKIEVGYALGVGLLDDNFFEVFSRGLANAAVFDGPRTIRTGLAGAEFLRDEKKKAWTLQELAKVVDVANRAADLAKAFGLTHVVENGREIIKGDGITSFGTTEFFANVNSNVGLQPDSANFFVTCRVLTKPEDARAFLEKYAKKIRYFHLKTSSKEHKATPVLSESELDFDIVFSLMTRNKLSYVAIELDGAGKLEQCNSNMQKSAEYLMNTF